MFTKEQKTYLLKLLDHRQSLIEHYPGVDLGIQEKISKERDIIFKTRGVIRSTNTIKDAE